jgi:hypothetical protein
MPYSSSVDRAGVVTRFSFPRTVRFVEEEGRRGGLRLVDDAIFISGITKKNSQVNIE